MSKKIWNVLRRFFKGQGASPSLTLLVAGGVNPPFIGPPLLRAKDEPFGLFVPDKERGGLGVRRLTETLHRLVHCLHGIGEVRVAHKIRVDVEQKLPFFQDLEMLDQSTDAMTQGFQRARSRVSERPRMIRDQADGSDRGAISVPDWRVGVRANLLHGGVRERIVTAGIENRSMPWVFR